MPARPARWPVLLPLLGGAGLLVWLALAVPTPPPAPLDEVPDRFAQIVLPDAAEAPVAAEAPAPPPAGVSAKKAARRPVREASGRGKDAGEGAADKQAEAVASGAVLGLLGTESGTGGLGTRGSGYGGGGTALGSASLGGRGAGLGTKGRGASSGDLVGLRGARQAAAAARAALVVDPDGGRAAADPATLVATADDPRSTFAADVDTGSYTLARRALREGRLPDPETVRVEEFLNVWRYDYPAPAGAPVAAHTTLVPHPDRPGRHLLQVGIQARTVAPADRKPVRLTFLVDVSGSMRGRDRLGLIQEALHHAIDRLGPEDSVAIVTYAGRTEVLAPPTPTTRRATLHRAVDRLTSGGGTDMGSGVALAYAQAEQSWMEGAENRVIVLSDGDANLGATRAEDILQTIRRHAEGGITLTTIGVGTGNYRDAMMERLADAGDGAYAYLDGPEEARRVLGTELGATLETVARDLKIQLDFDPAVVQGWRQIGYANRQVADRDFRNDAVDAGEVGSGHQVTALYELALAPGWDAHPSLGTVRLRAKPPGPDRPAEEWSRAVPARRGDPTDGDVALATAAMHLALGLSTRSPAALAASRQEAARLAAAGRTGADELVDLAHRARALVGEGTATVAMVP